MYPRESAPRDRLGIIYETLGRYDKSLAEMREALRLSSESSVAYGNVVDANLWLNRFDEARATAEGAQIAEQSIVLLDRVLSNSSGQAVFDNQGLS
jgi:Flp pilus assembly protein TadD